MSRRKGINLKHKITVRLTDAEYADFQTLPKFKRARITRDAIRKEIALRKALEQHQAVAE